MLVGDNTSVESGLGNRATGPLRKRCHGAPHGGRTRPSRRPAYSSLGPATLIAVSSSHRWVDDTLRVTDCRGPSPAARWPSKRRGAWSTATGGVLCRAERAERRRHGQAAPFNSRGFHVWSPLTDLHRRSTTREPLLSSLRRVRPGQHTRGQALSLELPFVHPTQFSVSSEWARTHSSPIRDSRVR